MAWWTRFLCLSALTVPLAASVPASAHIELVSPPSRYGRDELKNGPCGSVDNGPGQHEPVVYEPGETIVVKYDEFINHEGHFRLSISVDGDQEFVDPKAYDDFYTADSVLLDNITDNASGVRSVELTLPDFECERCTLQMIQMMVTSAPYDPDDALYYQCADIILRRSDTTDSGSDSQSDTTTGNDSGDPDSNESESSSSTGDDQETSSTDNDSETSSQGEDSSGNEDSSSSVSTETETLTETLTETEDDTTDETSDSSQGQSDDPSSESSDTKGCGIAGPIGGIAGPLLLLIVVALRRRQNSTGAAPAKTA
jgi:hypothetical protein